MRACIVLTGNAPTRPSSPSLLLRQVTLADFRRLCILKGVYPRDPSKKVKGKDKTYYALKDIQFLMHEPVLTKLREIRAHNKKITRARGRKDPFKVQLLEKTKPFYMLDHLVKERFPTFIDAVRDMDDALCMATIFANLPSTENIEAKRTENCTRLCLEFHTHVALTHSLRKVFLSIKGCYFQAEIMGQPVTWLVPYEFSQELPDDVDYRVMLTFLELYETQLRFINFRLYTQMGLSYPPRINRILDDANSGLASLQIEKVGDAAKTAGAVAASKGKKAKAAAAGDNDAKPHKNLKSLQSKMSNIEKGGSKKQGGVGGGEGLEEDLNKEVGDDDDDAEGQGEDDNLLFKGLKIFIAREVSMKLFEFVARAFGAQVGWAGEGSPFDESDEGITHQVVDRDFQKRRILSREYVQPQWLADCANSGLLLPIAPYMPGNAPPPHLSPFVNDEEEGYVPDQRKFILSLQEESGRHAGTVGDESEDEAAERDGESGEEEDDEGEFERGLEAERKGKGGDDDEDDEGEKEEEEEEEKKAAPSRPATGASRAAKRKAEEESRAKLMMPKKDKRLYEKIKFADARKAQRVATLESRKAK